MIQMMTRRGITISATSWISAGKIPFAPAGLKKLILVFRKRQVFEKTQPPHKILNTFECPFLCNSLIILITASMLKSPRSLRFAPIPFYHTTFDLPVHTFKGQSISYDFTIAPCRRFYIFQRSCCCANSRVYSSHFVRFGILTVEDRVCAFTDSNIT